MANHVAMVNYFAEAIHEMVQENVDENQEILAENLSNAAKHAKEELSDPSGHNQGGASRRGWTSLSGGYGNPIRLYSKGWKVYGKQTSGKIYRTVANASVPTLTHLLEFGHAKPGKKGRVKGDKAIERAYENASKLAEGSAT